MVMKEKIEMKYQMLNNSAQFTNLTISSEVNENNTKINFKISMLILYWL